VRRDFLYGDSLLLSAARKLGKGAVYQVLDKREGGVEIGPDVEGDRKRVRAVAAAGRRHVYSALDTIHGLLDRNSDGFRYDLGARSGVFRRNLYRWRNDLRILGDRELE